MGDLSSGEHQWDRRAGQLEAATHVIPSLQGAVWESLITNARLVALAFPFWNPYVGNEG